MGDVDINDENCFDSALEDKSEASDSEDGSNFSTDDDCSSDDDESFRAGPFEPKIEPFANPPLLFKSTFSVTPISSPLQILQEFVTDDIMSEVVRQVNLYAEEDKLVHPPSYSNWKDVDVAELWNFFGVSFMMGIIKKPAIKDYWTTDPTFSTPLFGKIMARDRYESILRALHFVDNRQVPKDNKNRFIKLGSFMTKILENFKNAIHPGEFICIDETLLKYKGRLSFRQYNPKKRARFGIKMFVLADCRTNMVLDVLPYQGKTTEIKNRDWIQSLGFGGASVMTLLQDYLDKAHKIVLDNWFLGPKLALELKKRNTYVLGTVQRRRKGMPHLQGKQKKGDVTTYCTQAILIERWEDRREVLILNTFMGHEMKVSESSNPKNTRLKPATVLLYNSTMGAVDAVDKTTKPYQSVRKSLKWYKKVAFSTLDVANYNAYVVYRIMKQDSKIPYKEFLQVLIKEIFQKYPIARKILGRPKIYFNQFPDRMVGMHLPKKHVKEDGKAVNSDCFYCKHFGEKVRKATPFSCSKCDVRLCIQGEESCFSLFHTQKILGSKRKRLSCPPISTDSEASCTSSVVPEQNSFELPDIDSEMDFF